MPWQCVAPDLPVGHSDVGNVGSFDVVPGHSLPGEVGANPELLDLRRDSNSLRGGAVVDRGKYGVVVHYIWLIKTYILSSNRLIDVYLA